MSNSSSEFMELFPSLLQQQQPQPLINDEPLFVNAKQYHRILKRREARQKYTLLRQDGYVHESRHKHAKKRLRGPGGRFLSSAEFTSLHETGRIVNGVILMPDPHALPSEHDIILEKLNHELIAASLKPAK